LRGQGPNPAITQKAYIQPKEGRTNPTEPNPVKDLNAKKSNTRQTQSSKSNADIFEEDNEHLKTN
jgi:hypothetical protein